MTDHTPGPWGWKTNRHPQTNGQPWGWVEAHPHPAGGGGAPPDGIGGITWKGEQGKANARLIAAAPDLLEALERLAAFRVNGPDDYDERDNVMHIAQRAIAKARGEAVASS